MQPGLQASLAEYEHLRERLRVEFPEADEVTLADTLEGVTSLPEMLIGVVRSQLEDQPLAIARRARISEMQGRLARLEDGVEEKKRAVVASVMARADIKNQTEPDFTVSLRPTPAPLIIVDETEVPEGFWKSQPPKRDRRGLLPELNASETLMGAPLGDGGITIAVRTS